jgi:hypothetical protein
VAVFLGPVQPGQGLHCKFGAKVQLSSDLVAVFLGPVQPGQGLHCKFGAKVQLSSDLVAMFLGPVQPGKGLVGQQEVILEVVTLQDVVVPATKLFSSSIRHIVFILSPAFICRTHCINYIHLT